MTEKAAVLIKKRDAKSFMEGAEHCREYVRDATLWFGTSVVPPGQRGDEGEARLLLADAPHLALLREQDPWPRRAGHAHREPVAAPEDLIGAPAQLAEPLLGRGIRRGRIAGYGVVHAASRESS